MNAKDRENLYKLFRDQVDLLGTTLATEVALESFKRAILALKCTRETVLPLYTELAEAIKNSRPKIVPLIHLLEEFEDEMRFTGANVDLDGIRKEACEILEEKLAAFREIGQRMVVKGAEYVADEDTIIVHSASRAVIGILERASQAGRRFQAIVLQQDFAKTRQLIQALEQARIPFEVVPEYTLSHHLGRATKLFIGAVAVTPDRNVVAAAGTAGVVSLCHVGQLPVYLFVNSLKFSHQSTDEQQIHRKEQRQSRDGLTYALTTHSHSLVPLQLIDHLVTETGEGVPPSHG
jgi:translation initiation factor 2B subunit (eIF-2B alpha/beta/delta family)